ncbi:hypothetical protein [Tautonia plasticadhaerens]|uniref:hypothetical protein n=1 Tax=Tautonia plasticadhaerens TaxID=2527974 RepID=UPI0018D203D4|nr:hypothetical protein [Tautonia plasticadhaerens]
MGRWQEEPEGTRTFDSPAREATLGIARTADRSGIRVSRLSREHGPTPSQHDVLRSSGARTNRCRSWRSPTAWSPCRASPA